MDDQTLSVKFSYAGLEAEQIKRVQDIITQAGARFSAGPVPKNTVQGDRSVLAIGSLEPLQKSLKAAGFEARAITEKTGVTPTDQLILKVRMP